ncbi:MAG: ArsR family transcriptional regulator [Candidatus Andeanibacterium colombiense]|uniref:ArsR family transcriptional regulator n=1 Tax=Candidatus Andeanibacterium colombiense TaxID=3121345 RepID=A0AAJ6BPK1_9SPHN|nr:MAG: ArsR family transcriptional regulator [Sphingomonadaceae bacterium]
MSAQSTALPPTIDDTQIWDAWLSMFRLPILNVNAEAGTFKALSDHALTTDELAAELQVDARALAMHLAALCADGYVEKRLGKWRATALARTWLHPEGQGNWSTFLSSIDRNEHLRTRLAESLKTGQRPGSVDERPANWEQGTMAPETAQRIAAFMQAHSQAPALGAARLPVFGTLKHLMDVGCGSGVYGIEIARANPSLKVTLMDLKEVAHEAGKYVAAAGVGAQVATAGVNMFTQEWPTGPDGHFFSNVFHDWSEETNTDLARRSFAALPSGGRIFLNEILMDDDYTGPFHAAAFSLLMLTGTLGKQYSLAEFRDILGAAGFVDVQAERSGGGYYSVVSARKK